MTKEQMSELDHLVAITSAVIRYRHIHRLSVHDIAHHVHEVFQMLKKYSNSDREFQAEVIQRVTAVTEDWELFINGSKP